MRSTPKLWEHQLSAIEAARNKYYYALFMEMGCGKTATLIQILREKFESDEKPLRTLILTPPITLENWKREILKYSNIPEEKIIILTGPLFFRLTATDVPRDALYITNYESLIMDKLFQRFLKFGFQAIVLDESHRIKTANSKRTKRVLKLGQLAKYRYCLSGTPILNSVSDIYPQVTFLDGGKTFGDSYYRFRDEYFVDFNRGMPSHCYFPNWKMKPDSVERVGKAIAPISSRVLKQDCLDLPPLIRQRVDCALTDEQADVYRSLEKDFVASIGDSQIVTDLELTKCLRLQQIVSGYCPDEKGVMHEFTPNHRIEAVREVLEGIGRDHKCLLWACFRENFRHLELLCNTLKLPFVSVYGGVKPEEQRSRCEKFETDDNIRILIGHARSCGIGVNLTAADYAIFYSRSYSLEDDLQAEARNYRGGSGRHRTIIRIDLVSANTIDEVILNALAAKESLSAAILQYSKLKKENPCYRQLTNRIKL